MIRTVFDTSILASIAIATGGPLALLRQAWKDREIDVAISAHILGELESALDKPYFTNRLSPSERQDFLSFVERTTSLVMITVPLPTVATTRADNMVLATASSAAADYLVSGDMELLRIRRHDNFDILAAREFADILLQ